MSTAAGEFGSGSGGGPPDYDWLVTDETGPECNSGHNGSKTGSTSAPAPAFDHPRTGSTVCGVGGQDGIQTTSANSDVATNRRQSVRMTSSNAQLNEARDESKILPQTTTEKDTLNSPKPSKSRKDQFFKVFPDIAETEEVIKSYHCAFFRDILLQGFLYITPNWFCFYSKLLGKKCIKIPVSVVTNITKKKTAIIIPNAIRVITETDKYVFGSLMSRDNTYQLMLNVWQEKRKMLQTNIPLEPEKSSINEGFETVASVSTNSTSSLMASAKDEFAVSSDASFCSDLESTSLSMEPLPLERPRSTSPTAAAGQREAAVDFANESAKPTVFRFPSTSQSTTSVGANPDRPNQSIQSKAPFTSVNDLVTWILNLPRTCLFLTISTVLVLFLLLSAMLLAYKLINLQMQLATYVGWSYRSDVTVESEPYREVLQDAYVTRHDFHISNVEKIHVILESHVEVLSKVNQVLKELQNLAMTSCLPVTPVVEKS